MWFQSRHFSMVSGFSDHEIPLPGSSKWPFQPSIQGHLTPKKVTIHHLTWVTLKNLVQRSSNKHGFFPTSWNQKKWMKSTHSVRWLSHYTQTPKSLQCLRLTAIPNLNARHDPCPGTDLAKPLSPLETLRSTSYHGSMSNGFFSLLHNGTPVSYSPFCQELLRAHLRPAL